MTSKRNLSDLLREEVKKGPQSNLSDPQAAPVPSSEEKSVSPSASSPAQAPSKPTMETNHTSDPQISLSRLTKADLEKKIHHLTEALQVSQEQETALQAQVVQLELALETQKHSIQELQTSLTQAQSLKPELERVRADALALAQENERLQAQLKSVKQGTVNLKPPVQQPARTPVGRSPKVVPIPSRSILDRPVMPTHPPNQTGKTSKGFDTWCYD